jgi:hypothetical protein
VIQFLETELGLEAWKKILIWRPGLLMTGKLFCWLKVLECRIWLTYLKSQQQEIPSLFV